METYLVKKTKEPNVDWNSIPKALINQYGWVDHEKFEAYAQIVFINNYGFKIKLTCFQTNPWALVKHDGGPVYEDSCLEAFFSFGEEGYINLETNSLGFRLQGFGKERHNRVSLISNDLDFSVKTIVDEDKWEVLIDLPLTKLKRLFGSIEEKEIKSGFEFKGNFYKTGTNPESKKEHYIMWNKIKAPSPDFHRPEQFGKLIIE